MGTGQCLSVHHSLTPASFIPSFLSLSVINSFYSLPFMSSVFSFSFIFSFSFPFCARCHFTPPLQPEPKQDALNGASDHHLSLIYPRFIIQWHLLGGTWRTIVSERAGSMINGAGRRQQGSGRREGHERWGGGSQRRHRIKWVADLAFHSSTAPVMEEGWTDRVPF